MNYKNQTQKERAAGQEKNDLQDYSSSNKTSSSVSDKKVTSNLSHRRLPTLHKTQTSRFSYQ